MITPTDLYKLLKSYGIEHSRISTVLREADSAVLKGINDSKKLSAALSKYGDILKATALYLEANYKEIIKAGLIKKLRKAFPSINFGKYIDDNMIKDYTEKYPHLLESVDARLEAITEFINNEIYRLYTYIVTDINEAVNSGSPVDTDEIFARYSIYNYDNSATSQVNTVTEESAVETENAVAESEGTDDVALEETIDEQPAEDLASRMATAIENFMN